MSNLENCPTCGNQTSENAEMCPACGEPLAKGWAEEVERERLEAKKAHELKEAARERQRIITDEFIRKSKWKMRFIFAVIIAMVIGGLVAKVKYDNYYESNLHEIDPVAFDQLIIELEAEVAKVPSSDFDENIRLYNKLQKINPDKKLYQDKITHYLKRKRASALEAERAAAKHPSLSSRRKEIIRLVKAQQTVDDVRWGQNISLWIWMADEGKNYPAVAEMFCRTVVRPRNLGTIFIHIWRRGTMDRMGKHKCWA